MRNLLLLLIISLMLCTCTDKAISTSTDSSGQLPNSDTRYITLNAVGIAEDKVLLNSLKQKLHKNHFSFSKTKKGGGTSFNNCDNNTILMVEGNGIVNFYAQSGVSEKVMKNTYADFSLTIFAFKNDKIAVEYHAMIEEALNTSSSEAYCNHKIPASILQRDNRIYYFVTRANMFTTHTVKYADHIKNFRR